MMSNFSIKMNVIHNKPDLFLHDCLSDDLYPQHKGPEIQNDIDLNVPTRWDDHGHTEQEQIHEVEELKNTCK